MPAYRLLAACLAAVLMASPALADDDDDDDSSDGASEVVAGQPAADENSPARVGLVYDTLRKARKQQTVFGKISDAYGDFKQRMEDDHGLTWSLSLSYRQRWIRPEEIGISTTSQTLFWPSLNWDMFSSETYGSGSFQFLYYGERHPGSTLRITRGSRTLSAEQPDYQNRFSQITYTHTLPGERLSLAIGQFSFFNFDSNEYLADQQLNFVNNIFSANGSSTYPVTGIGAYIQFNAAKTLQFLAGGQGVNEDNSSRRPNNGLGNSPRTWLGYVQWTPHLKGLGEAQYSLTLYQAPETNEQAKSKGWSINAVQHLNDKWALIGRLNASSDDSGGSKRSYGVGVALNNPLGRNEADQIGVAYGSLEQKKPLLFQTLQHTQNTLEAYWNWSLIDGLLLTPDAQYIRHPAFAPGRDSAWILSLRTTLVF